MVFRVANLLAIAGTSWMALSSVGIHFSRRFRHSMYTYTWLHVILAITELIFALPFLFFFICLYLYNRTEGRPVVPGNVTITALVGSAWMFIVAVCHRFPVVWSWVAMRGSGMVIALTEIVFTIPLLLFFVLFGVRRSGVQFTIRLRVAAKACIVALSWFLLVSAARLSAILQRSLIEIGARRFIAITEPLVAISLLLFLVMFYFERAVWNRPQSAARFRD